MRDAHALTYAVADLHGRLDLLEAALEAIEEDAGAATSRTIVFLGDYVDRGPDSAGVLDRLMQGPREGWRWICLKGNHEAVMVLGLLNPDRLDWWIENGGDATIRSYRDEPHATARHLPWIEALPAIHVDTHRVYAHGGVDTKIPLDQQQEKVLLWKRYPPEASEGFGARHLVHGHEALEDGPLLLAGRTDLDTKAWHTGRLVVGVFDDALPGGPIDTIEIRRRGA